MSAEEGVQMLLEEGAAAIESLPTHANRLSATISKTFPKQSLEQVGKAMTAAATSGPKDKVNAQVAALGVLVREEAASASHVFRQAEQWLHMKTPAVSDGNNFGVDVQQYVLGELVKMRGSVEEMLVTGRDYHWTRAKGLDALLGDSGTVTTTKSSENVDDGKTKLSTSNDKTVSEKTPAGYPDYKEYLVSVDVRAYHHAFTQLTDLRNFYIRAHAMFAKNSKRLADPRGEGEDGRAHSMSMF